MNEKTSETYILGIDTGGTYTDSVILRDYDKKLICKSKSLTTKNNLQVGISNSIKNLNFDEKDKISLISLSTTLATNAIIEGNGCRTGLILIGKKPIGSLPVDDWYLVNGQIDISGNEIEAIRPKEIEEIASKFMSSVDAIAVSGYASVRNPKQENEIKNIISRITTLPVFCAHELSGSLGFLERTVTSALNASLINIIKDFIRATKKALTENEISAPIMIVKGDGSFMQESLLMEKPIETVLSGPAASIIGAGHLTDVKDALIFDMGGTTSDVANIANGKVKTNDEGATVGHWMTRVRAADIYTTGLGGDSLIYIDDDIKIHIGPEKVEPLCIFSTRYPQIIEKIKMNNDEDSLIFYRMGEPSSYVLNNTELRVIELLEKEPKSFAEISKSMKAGFSEKKMHRLMMEGCIVKCSFTPTDILHIQKKYTEWNADIANKAIEILAAKVSMKKDELTQKIYDEMIKKLSLFCFQSAVNFDNEPVDLLNDEIAMYLLDKAFNSDDGFLSADFSLNKPIIGVGAPVHTWLPDVAKKLCTELIIPENAEVANAIGAAIGVVTESARAVIRPDKKNKQYILHMPEERLDFPDLKDAEDFAEINLKEHVIKKAQKAGGINIEAAVTKEQIFTHSFSNSNRLYVETRVEAIAVSKSSF